MAQQSDEELQQELQDDYVENETLKGTGIGMGLGALAGSAAGVAIGAEAGAALVVGTGAVISAPVVVPAAIGAAVIGVVGTGIAHMAAKDQKIEALDRQGKKLSLKGAEQQLLARMKEMKNLKQQKKSKDQEKKKLLNGMRKTESNMKKQKETFKQQVKEHGYKRDKSQIIMVMIGKTGHGKSTFCNRMSGDKSKKGNQGPFTVSAKKDKAGTTKVISNITTAPFANNNDADIKCNDEEGVYNATDEAVPDEIELEIIDLDDKKEEDKKPSLLIVDTPGWGDVKEDNRDNHKNLVVRYLKGCGGINTFVMIISNRDRIDGSIQQMLKEYEALFEAEFWKHLIIAVTGVDDEDDLEEFEEEEHEKDIQKLLKNKFANLKENVPVIPIGKKTYSKQVPLIMDKIPKQKFTCNALKGPYELLKEKYQGMKIDLQGINAGLKQLETSIRSNEVEIKGLKQEVSRLKGQLRK